MIKESARVCNCIERNNILKRETTELNGRIASQATGLILFLSVTFFFSVGEVSSQVNNSLVFSRGEEPVPEWISRINQGQSEVEVIPFTLDENIFDEDGDVKVSLRVYNILQHFVAIPLALESDEQGGLQGKPVMDLKIDEPGMYFASWDRLDHGGDQVAPGVYFVELFIESEAMSKDEIESEQIRIPRRGGIRGFLNTISPGDPFKESVSDNLQKGTRSTVMRIVIS